MISSSDGQPMLETDPKSGELYFPNDAADYYNPTMLYGDAVSSNVKCRQWMRGTTEDDDLLDQIEIDSDIDNPPNPMECVTESGDEARPPVAGEECGDRPDKGGDDGDRPDKGGDNGDNACIHGDNGDRPGKGGDDVDRPGKGGDRPAKDGDRPVKDGDKSEMREESEETREREPK